MEKFQTVVLIVVDEHYSNTRNITTLIRWLFILPLPPLLHSVRLRNFDVFQRIKYPSQNEEEIGRKTLKLRTVKDDTRNPHFSKILSFVRPWFNTYGETKCAKLANSIQGKI